MSLRNCLTVGKQHAHLTAKQITQNNLLIFLLLCSARFYCRAALESSSGPQNNAWIGAGAHLLRQGRREMPVPTFALSRFISLFNPLVKGLQNSRIHSGDDVHGSIQLFFADPCFPCVRKATIYSRITETHHRDREADQHFLTVGKTFDGVRLTIKGSKVCFFQGSLL